MCVWKDENKSKRGRGWPIKKYTKLKFVYDIGHLVYINDNILILLSSEIFLNEDSSSSG